MADGRWAGTLIAGWSLAMASRAASSRPLFLAAIAHLILPCHGMMHRSGENCSHRLLINTNVVEPQRMKRTHRVLGSLNDVKHDQFSHKARGPQHHDLVSFLHDRERQAMRASY